MRKDPFNVDQDGNRRMSHLPERSEIPSRCLLAVSYNEPKLCANASWNPDAITFANSTIIERDPMVLFITRENLLVTTRRGAGQILIWHNATSLSILNISTSWSSAFSLFVTSDDQIFVSTGDTPGQVEGWTMNGTRVSSTSFLCSACYGLFVDLKNNLYCSAHNCHQVMCHSLTDPSGAMTIVAGTGSSGTTAQTLDLPFGIFVTIDFDLYVADHRNDRVQLFRSGERNGVTVVGRGSTETIVLSRPVEVVVDGDGYLFVVDVGYDRIIGSGPNGFRCVVGCSGSSGSAANELNWPRVMRFDIDGNIFVIDEKNHRMQKFLLLSDECGKQK